MEVQINGIPYKPAGATIGVGVTTRNRPDILETTLQHIRKHTPNAHIVVVDDASTVPVPEADFRFPENVGIARAKNKCLELLYDAGINHMFLFDDDCYPQVDNWWTRYVESPEPHLMWMFEKPKGATKSELEVIYQDDQHVAYHATRGAMLYVERHVLETVGGMDPDFGKWGWEHVSWSDRIHSAGLTTWRYADVADSGEIIYSLDREGEVKSTADDEAVRFSQGPGMELRIQSRHSDRYIEFRELENVVLTTLLTDQTDPQRGNTMKADPKLLETLYKSLNGASLKVMHTSLSDPGWKNAEFLQVAQHVNPYFQRHIANYHYLRDNPNVGFVWCVDGTDVVMLRDPFPEMTPGTLYVGCEASTLRNQWMIDNHPDSKIQTFLKANPNHQLLNAGLIGGDRVTVMRFLHALVKEFFDDTIDWIHGWETARLGVGDMGIFNVVAYEQFGDRLSYGSHVNTVFKAEEKNNTTAWWSHK